MSVTIRQLASSAEIQLQQMYDDAKIPFSLLCFWAAIFANKARKLDLQGKLTPGKNLGADMDGWDNSGADISIFPEIPVYTATQNVTNFDDPSLNIPKGTKYIIIPGEVDDAKNNRAIDYISYKTDIDPNFPAPAHNTFHLTTRSRLRRAMMDPYEKPSPSHPYGCRVGNLIHLVGIERINVRFVEVALRQKINADDIDEGLPIDDYVDIILEQIIKMALIALQTPEELNNDGSGEMKRAPNQKVDLNAMYDSGGAQNQQME